MKYCTNRQIKAVTYAKAYGTKLIINDHIELTRKVDAHGVHLGANDGTIANARRILPSGKIIGKTVHSIEEALSAQKDKPDYVGLGPYRTPPPKKISSLFYLIINFNRL